MASYDAAKTHNSEMDMHNDAVVDDTNRDFQSNAVDSHLDEEEAKKKWLSTAYERGSKKPMRKPLTAPWDVPINNTDMEKLKAGLKARSMDDKWEILVEDPNENGTISLHILRSWLQEECYVLDIVPTPSGDNGGSAKIERITWEGDHAGLQCPAEQAKKEAVVLCRTQVGCELETLPKYPSSVLWDTDDYTKVDAE
ncbi:hypothetical protein EV356DRAFT_497871 [Viridothelium virens]|uniref:Uncharacterized protein n=1 Tax=Viridothelium virens TaxID=1048519 RepID=A0A6A6GSB5_VIRVR|nr:hypothetical protein EV356DRAFT_497871 [Viridothelium virens]